MKVQITSNGSDGRPVMTYLHSSGKDGIREDGSLLELVEEPNEENGDDEDEERSE